MRMRTPAASRTLIGLCTLLCAAFLVGRLPASLAAQKPGEASPSQEKPTEEQMWKVFGEAKAAENHGDYERAVVGYFDALKLAQALDNKQRIGVIHNSLGNIYQSQGLAAGDRRLLMKARDEFKE